MSIFPQLGRELSASIAHIRNLYDPSAVFAASHITVLFPVPGEVGEDRLSDHIQSVLVDRSAFEIQLGGFQKSHDHWLFLTLSAGEEQIKDMYRSLNSGILADYRRSDIEFIPHLGLGLFIRKGVAYNWDDPRATDFDHEQFEAAMSLAKKLPLPISIRVDSLILTELPDEILAWATGKRSLLPEGVRMVKVREFRLPAQPANLDANPYPPRGT